MGRKGRILLLGIAILFPAPVYPADRDLAEEVEELVSSSARNRFIYVRRVQEFLNQHADDLEPQSLDLIAESLVFELQKEGMWGVWDSEVPAALLTGPLRIFDRRISDDSPLLPTLFKALRNSWYRNDAVFILTHLRLSKKKEAETLKEISEVGAKKISPSREAKLAAPFHDWVENVKGGDLTIFDLRDGLALLNSHPGKSKLYTSGLLELMVHAPPATRALLAEEIQSELTGATDEMAAQAAHSVFSKRGTAGIRGDIKPVVATWWKRKAMCDRVFPSLLNTRRERIMKGILPQTTRQWAAAPVVGLAITAGADAFNENVRQAMAENEIYRSHLTSPIQKSTPDPYFDSVGEYLVKTLDRDGHYVESAAVRKKAVFEAYREKLRMAYLLDAERLGQRLNEFRVPRRVLFDSDELARQLYENEPALEELFRTAMEIYYDELRKNAENSGNGFILEDEEGEVDLPDLQALADQPASLFPYAKVNFTKLAELSTEEDLRSELEKTAKFLLHQKIKTPKGQASVRWSEISSFLSRADLASQGAIRKKAKQLGLDSRIAEKGKLAPVTLSSVFKLDPEGEKKQKLQALIGEALLWKYEELRSNGFKDENGKVELVYPIDLLKYQRNLSRVPVLKSK